MDLSVVVLSYNTRDLLEQALRTVMDAAADLEVEVFVADNASRDGSADMVAEKFPSVKLIRNSRNLGFSAGNNVALRQIVGRHMLLLNPDTIVRRDTLRCLVEFMDAHPEAGAAGCKILNPDGTLQLDSKRGFPTPMAAFCKMSGLGRLFPHHPVIARYNMTYLDPEAVSQVEVLSGSCMMVRRETLDQVGLLDEDYFMYGEDIDWCFRIHQAGWKIYYVPHTEIIHYRGESGRAEPLRVLYQKSKAMSIFVNKHMKQRYRFFPVWLLQLAIALYGALKFVANLGRHLVLPLLDGVLMLAGLKLGLTLRYHSRLEPLIHAVERLSGKVGLEVNPTRWLTPPPYSDFQWVLIYFVPLAIWLSTFYLLGLYDRRKFSVVWSAVAVALGFAAVVTTVFFFKAYNFSRLAAGAAWFFNTLLVSGWRLGARLIMHTRRGRRLGRRRTLLVGTDATAAAFLGYLEKLGWLDYEVVGLVGQEQEDRGRAVGGKQVVGLADELQQLVQSYAIDELIFTSGTVSYSLAELGKRQGRRNLRIRMVTGSFESLLAGQVPTSADELPLIEISSNR